MAQNRVEKQLNTWMSHYSCKMCNVWNYLMLVVKSVTLTPWFSQIFFQIYLLRICLNMCVCSGFLFVWAFFFFGRGLWFLLCFGLWSVLMQLSFFCLKWRVFSINADSYTEVLQADKKCYCFQIIVLPLGKMYSDLLFYYCIY